MEITQVFAVVFSSWFGIGFIPLFPNALAVAATCLLIVVVAPHLTQRRLLATVTGVTIVGIWASSAWGGLSEISDDRRIVIDEAAGYLLAMLIVRRGDAFGAFTLALMFVALDALKPWPFDRIEMLPLGLGVMGDDLAVGLVLGIVWALGARLWPAINRAGSDEGIQQK